MSVNKLLTKAVCPFPLLDMQNYNQVPFALLKVELCFSATSTEFMVSQISLSQNVL